MKKLSYILLLIVLCFGMCIGFTACGPDEEPPATSYTITFKEEGFDDVTRTVEEGKDLPATEIPVIQGSKVGYTIAWEQTEFKNVTADLTVNAVATPNTYTITINNNGGSGVSSLNVTFDSAYQLPTPTKSGCTFVEWRVGSQVFPATGTWTNPSDITVKAIWRENANEVFFKGLTKSNFKNTWEHFNGLRNTDGGVILDIKSNVEFIDPTEYIVKSGFEFICFVNDDGKYIELGVERNGKKYVEQNQTVIAYFAEVEAGKQVVAFLEDGFVPVIREVNDGETLTDIPNVQENRPGYELTWSVQDFTNITETVRVYTEATEKTFRIYYNYDPSKISSDKIAEFNLIYDSTTQSYYQEVKYLASYELLDEIVDVTYKLGGWREIDSDEPFFGGERYELTEDITLVATEIEKNQDDMTNDDNWSTPQ